MKTSKPADLFKTTCAASLILLLSACSKINELKVIAPDTFKTGTQSEIRIKRTGKGSGNLDLSNKDDFNYYFASSPGGKFAVEVIEGKKNDYCHTTGSHEVTDGVIHNEIKREMLIKENSNGEVTIAIACHKPVYRIISRDSAILVQMIVEDVDFKVSDTVVFKIIR